MKAYYVKINDEPSWNGLCDLVGDSKKEGEKIAKESATKLGHEIFFVPFFKSKEDALESVPEQLICECGCEAESVIAEIDIPEFNFPNWE